MVAANIVLLVLSIIIFVGFLANLLFRVTKVPDVIGLMVLGVLIAQFDIISRTLLIDALPVISAIALVIILFEAGLNIELGELFQNAPRGTVLAIINLAFSIVLVGVVGKFLLGLDFLVAGLLGAIIGGTSSPLVLSIVEDGNAGENVLTTLRIESIVTDPLVIVVSLALLEAVVQPGALSVVLRDIAGSFSLSIAFGFIAGITWLFALNKTIEEERFTYILTLGFLFMVYALTDGLGGSGAVSAFVFGIVLANASKISDALSFEGLVFGIPERAKHFNEELSFFIKTFFFTTLGAILTFKNPLLFVYGAGLTLVVFASRYLSVQLGMWGTTVTTGERHFMTTIMPRGLAAAIVAFIPITRYRADASLTALQATETFPEIVFSVIIGSILISTLGSYLHSQEEQEEQVLTEQGEVVEKEVELQPVETSHAAAEKQ